MPVNQLLTACSACQFLKICTSGFFTNMCIVYRLNFNAVVNIRVFFLFLSPTPIFVTLSVLWKIQGGGKGANGRGGSWWKIEI